MRGMRGETTARLRCWDEDGRAASGCNHPSWAIAARISRLKPVIGTVCVAKAGNVARRSRNGRSERVGRVRTDRYALATVSG